MGALYGALSEYTGKVRAGAGTAFGVTLFAGADELALPALGLAEWESAPSSHIYGLTSHIVYALSSQLMRRALRSAL